MNRRVLFITSLLCCTLLARLAFSSRAVASPPSQVKSFPTSLDGWSSNGDISLSADILNVLKADDYLERSYVSARGLMPADLFIAYYRNQSAGESMHSPRNCLPGSGWEPISKNYVPLAPPSGSPVQINRFVIQKDGRKALVLYWYQAQGRVIANEYLGKAQLVWQALRSGRRDGAIVRVTVPIIDDNTDASDKAGMSLARAVYSQIPSYLPQ